MADSPKTEKILIIESDTTFGQQVRDDLDQSGYKNLIIVKNGAEAMKAIIDNLPHLVILDVAVSGADGYEIIEKKNAEPLLAKIPLFLLSTQSDPINMRRIPAGSVTEFLVGLQINPKELVDKVNFKLGHVEEAVPASSIQPGNMKKLLWVEDDRLIGSILAKKLIASGFDLHHAKNGEEAIEMLKQTPPPDMVVLDLLLPGMSGFDILQKVKENESTKKTPVMILSNLSKQSDIERAKMLGAQKFLVKAAVSLDQIVDEIRSLAK